MLQSNWLGQRFRLKKASKNLASGFEPEKQTVFGHRDAINRVFLSSMQRIGRKKMPKYARITDLLWPQCKRLSFTLLIM
jgi:hypothetical protein